MSKNEKLKKFRNLLKGSIKRVDHPLISDRAEVVEKDKKYQIYYIPGNFSNFFEELDILGEGCVGLVKKVRKISTGEYFASKMVKLKDEETVLQVISEFKNIKKLNHHNIVRVYELYVDEIKRRIYTIMELVEAREMFEVIHKLGSYSEQIASRIFKQVLTCIKYMHEQYVCHRDLKPNNILATEDGQCVKITDFNISKFGSTSKKEQFYNKNIKMWTYTGTVSFSAPEVFSEDEYDQSVDIWSAGVVLYTMLSGQEPFQAEYLQDLIAKIQNADYQFQSDIWASISNEAKDLIQKCLILNPKERISPDQALLHPWITGKQNTSPLTLIIFNNFENNARRLSKKLRAYQNLGLMKPINRKISIDCSILQRSNNHYNESDFTGDSPYAKELAQLTRSRKESGNNSKNSSASLSRNISTFQEVNVRSEQNRTDELNLPMELAKIQLVYSPQYSPQQIQNSPLEIISSISRITVFEEESELESDKQINRAQKSYTFSEQLQPQNPMQTSNKLKRIQSLQIDQQNEEKTNLQSETPGCKQITTDAKFPRFVRAQKTHKTLILHDRYKLNEEEQFLISQNQFSQQTIDPTQPSLYPYQQDNFNSKNNIFNHISNNNINMINNNNNHIQNSSLDINPSLVLLGDSYLQPHLAIEGVSIKMIPTESIKLEQNRKKVRHYTLNEKQRCYHFPK